MAFIGAIAKSEGTKHVYLNARFKEWEIHSKLAVDGPLKRSSSTPNGAFEPSTDLQQRHAGALDGELCLSISGAYPMRLREGELIGG